MKNIKTKIKSLALYSSLFFVIAIVLNIGLIKAYYLAEAKALELFPAYSSYLVSTTKKAQADEPSMKEWITNAFKSAGLNSDVADCVIFGESGYDPNKVNKKSVDLGIMQWSVQHVESGLISLECTGNYKCSVNAAIKKIKKDGGWNAWVAYRSNHCERFGATFKK